MKIPKATAQYERWLRSQTPVSTADLTVKHTAMAQDPFSFLRATFYRWVQRWTKICPALAAAPVVLAIGDLHVENFGTWRDSEGRLVWGINDFDEAYPMPYTNDLLRLAVSAHLAIDGTHLAIGPKDACGAILQGYTDGLAAGGRPFVLAEHATWLHDIAVSELREPVRFWKKMDTLKPLRLKVPTSARQALERALPEPDISCRYVKRIAGLGSLGRQRIVALGDWRGGRIAREAKAFVPSACVWQRDAKLRGYYELILRRAVRCPDPSLHLRGRWIIRRLAPDCSRIELPSMPKQRDEMRLLHAMGWETANIHLGTSKRVADIKRDVRKRKSEWLHAASKDMLALLRADFRDWQASHRR